MITVALGIGANSAIFALVDATLLRPLPFPRPERLVMVWERHATSLRSSVAPLNLLDWNEQNRTFDLMAGFISGVGGMVMAGADGTAETVPRQWVVAGIFDVLGVKPTVGRTFLPSDDTRRANVVVLSEAFWRTRFNADPRVVGRDIRLDGAPHTVVGVVPKEAQLLGRTSIWALRPIRGAPPEARSVYFAYSVQQRVRDFGVRRALGATTGAVARLVVGSAARVIATGTVIGLILSAISGRVLASVLFGVRPLDPVTFASVTIVLALTAAVAIAIPAWHATRIDPAVALREE